MMHRSVKITYTYGQGCSLGLETCFSKVSVLSRFREILVGLGLRLKTKRLDLEAQGLVYKWKFSYCWTLASKQIVKFRQSFTQS